MFVNENWKEGLYLECWIQLKFEELFSSKQFKISLRSPMKAIRRKLLALIYVHSLLSDHSMGNNASLEEEKERHSDFRSLFQNVRVRFQWNIVFQLFLFLGKQKRSKMILSQSIPNVNKLSADLIMLQVMVIKGIAHSNILKMVAVQYGVPE